MIRIGVCRGDDTMSVGRLEKHHFPGGRVGDVNPPATRYNVGAVIVLLSGDCDAVHGLWKRWIVWSVYAQVRDPHKVKILIRIGLYDRLQHMDRNCMMQERTR